jgi:hypothetical protein
VFKDALEINQDDDIVNHHAADPDKVQGHNQGWGPGPDDNDIRFDMNGGLKSEWNNAVFRLLLNRSLELKKDDNLPERSEAYIKDLIEERFKRLRILWKACQPRATDSGKPETRDELEDRINHKKDAELKNARHATRRRNVRSSSLLFIVKLSLVEI